MKVPERRSRNGSREALEMSEVRLIQPGHASEKYHDGYDDQVVRNDVVLFQQSGEEHMGIEIIKADIKEVTDKEEKRNCLFRNKRGIHRTGIKDQGEHQETAPGSNMDYDLGSFFIQGKKR